MKNYQECWAKTLLNINSYLDRICEAIDKNVMSCSMNSAHSQMGTDYFADRIIKLVERKKFMINIRVLINNTLKNISLENAKILTIKFVDHIKTDTACKLLDMPYRTYFRKVDKAISQFAFELKKQGYDESMLYQIFKNEFWVLEVFDNYAKKNIKKSEKFNLLQIALQSIKKSVYASCYWNFLFLKGKIKSKIATNVGIAVIIINKFLVDKLRYNKLSTET